MDLSFSLRPLSPASPPSSRPAQDRVPRWVCWGGSCAGLEEKVRWWLEREVRLPGEGWGSWGWSSHGPLPLGPALMVGSLGGSGESVGGRKLGTRVGFMERPRPLSFSPRPPGAGCGAQSLVFCQGSQQAAVSHTQTTNSPSWFSTPAGRCLLEAGALGRQRLPAAEVGRGLEERPQRRGQKPPPPPPASPRSAGLRHARASDSKEADYIMQLDSLLASSIPPQSGLEGGAAVLWFPGPRGHCDHPPA